MISGRIITLAAIANEDFVSWSYCNSERFMVLGTLPRRPSFSLQHVLAPQKGLRFHFASNPRIRDLSLLFCYVGYEVE